MIAIVIRDLAQWFTALLSALPDAADVLHYGCSNGDIRTKHLNSGEVDPRVLNFQRDVICIQFYVFKGSERLFA